MKVGVFFVSISRNGLINFRFKKFLKKKKYGGVGLDLSEDF